MPRLPVSSAVDCSSSMGDKVYVATNGWCAEDMTGLGEVEVE